MIWEYDLPLDKPLSLNSRQHWRVKAKEVAEARALSHKCAKFNRLPKGLQRVKVTLTYHPTTNRRRDAENLVATLKPVVDGLVEYGLIPDDTDPYLEPTMPRIGELSEKRIGKTRIATFTVKVEQLCGPG